MINRRSSILALSLSVLIALTSVTMSLARGQMRDTTGSMVLCTGTGPVSVQLDANGQPIGPIHVCPDCAIGALFSVNDIIDWSLPNSAEVALEFDTGVVEWPTDGLSHHRARGPPGSRRI